ncbi:MAG: DUF4236 domain-containing protein [Firmicutes bacterium]|nr:DUF4236 domain-containing protein [Bacillota bacterium]
MAVKFKKSVKISSGVKINFNKNSASATFGGKGLHQTISSTGRKTTTVGIPRTGLYYTESKNRKQNTELSPTDNLSGCNHVQASDEQCKKDISTKWYQIFKIAFGAMLAIMCLLLMIVYLWAIIGVIFGVYCFISGIKNIRHINQDKMR